MASLYPDVKVIHANSGQGIFRFDDNIRFCNHHLRPLIDEERNAMVKVWRDEWTAHFQLTIALAGGAPARYAIHYVS